MRKIKVTLNYCGEIVVAEMRVRRGLTLKRIKDLLECNATVLQIEEANEVS